MALFSDLRDSQRLRKRDGKLRPDLFTFLEHPKRPADNNGSKREMRPTVTGCEVAGGFRSAWGADMSTGVRSVIHTATRRSQGARQATKRTLRRQAYSYPGCADTACLRPASLRDQMTDRSAIRLSLSFYLHANLSGNNGARLWEDQDASASSSLQVKEERARAT